MANIVPVHFNSIKVQLILSMLYRIVREHKFQFHKGTINTQADEARPEYDALFQFHKGTINTIRRSY